MRISSQASNAPALSASGESFHATEHESAAQASPPAADAGAACDQWQVIDQVSTLELAGTDNSARYRTMAQLSVTLVEWLASHEEASGIEHSLAIAAEAWLASSGAAKADVGATEPPRAQTDRIDLSLVVNKYIGETEKNLDLVFDRAERSDAVLLFDEADALLGKRTDVKDSHDRYANMQANDPPQRLERREGVATLASDSLQPIDPDVLKRLRAQVPLPAPPGPPRSRN